MGFEYQKSKYQPEYHPNIACNIQADIQGQYASFSNINQQ
jgi:hypothetical protein